MGESGDAQANPNWDRAAKRFLYIVCRFGVPEITVDESSLAATHLEIFVRTWELRSNTLQYTTLSQTKPWKGLMESYSQQ